MKYLVILALFGFFAASESAVIIPWDAMNDDGTFIDPQTEFVSGVPLDPTLLSEVRTTGGYPIWAPSRPSGIIGGGILNNNFLPIDVLIPNLLSSLLINI